MRNVVVIPARGGSKGVPGKNKRPLAGIPLVARALRAASGAASVDAVYVSTDDPEIALISRDWGAVPVIRPPEISGDTASSESALLHALEVIERAEGTVANLVFLQCTSPFLAPSDVESVITCLVDTGADCAFSVVEDHVFLWSIDSSGNGNGVNHDETKPRMRRQDMPAQYRETGAIYAMKRDSFVAAGNRFCGKVVPVPIDADPMEIDTPDDWARAEALAWQNEIVRAWTADADLFSQIKAIVTDFDGVHTDDKVIVDQDGREAVVCSRRDGMGLEKLRKAGYRILILSKEQNPVVARRAEKLRLEVIHGVEEKVTVLSDWLGDQGLRWGDLIFVGNDINDLPCLEVVGCAVAVADSYDEVLDVADVVLSRPGGHGALRELADALRRRLLAA